MARKASNYQLFMTSFLRAKARAGMSRAERNDLMREGARAWKRGKRGENPFPDLEEREGPAHLACPGCGALLQVTSDLDGQVVECGDCGAQFRVEVS